MFNIKKKNNEINNLLKNSNFSTKIFLYMSTKTVGADFDSYEKNYTYSNLNPITIKGYVRDIKTESLVWKQYGLSEIGAKEIICEDKYENYFRLCNKIEINGDIYQTYKEVVGNRFLIEQRPIRLIRVIVKKVQ